MLSRLIKLIVAFWLIAPILCGIALIAPMFAKLPPLEQHTPCDSACLDELLSSR